MRNWELRKCFNESEIKIISENDRKLFYDIFKIFYYWSLKFEDLPLLKIKGVNFTENRRCLKINDLKFTNK